MLPEIVSQVLIMKLAPSCLSHILIRKTLPFPEAPGCCTSPSTCGAADNPHPSAVLGGSGYLLATDDSYIALHFLWALSLQPFSVHGCFLLTNGLTPSPMLMLFSIIWRGMIWFHLPLSLPQPPKMAEKKGKTHLSMTQPRKSLLMRDQSSEKEKRLWKAVRWQDL